MIDQEALKPATHSPTSHSPWTTYDAEHRNAIDHAREADDLRSERMAPFGYLLEPWINHRDPTRARRGIKHNRFVPHPANSQVVARIFAMNLKGIQSTDIARALTVEAVPTPADSRASVNALAIWSEETVRLILANPRYTGYSFSAASGPSDMDWVRSKAPTHTAIVSVDDYMASWRRPRSQQEKSRKRTVVTNPLQGQVWCGECGRRASRKSGVRYVCQPNPTGRTSRTNKHAQLTSIREDALMPEVLHWAAVTSGAPRLDATMSAADINAALKASDINVLYCEGRVYIA